MSKHTSYPESGRTILETIAVLAILAILTIGGVKGFSALRNNYVAKNLSDRTLDLAVYRQNSFLSYNWNREETPDKLTREGAMGVPVTVENGLTGALENLFWVSIGSDSTPVPKIICEKLLERRDSISSKTLPIVATTIGNDNITVQASETDCTEENIIRFYFPKRSGNTADSFTNLTFTPTLEQPIEEGNNCPERLCPDGATCTDNIITCLPGYKMIHAGTCNVTCEACTGGTYNNTSDTANSDCNTCDPGKTSHDHKTCVCLNEGASCTTDNETTGYTKHVGNDCACVECLENSHCATGYTCNDEGQCEECAGDSVCSSCPTETPIWDGLNTCIACPNNLYIAEGVCTACPEGSTSTGPNATECSCNVNRVYNATNNTCDCPDNFYVADGVCTACPQGQVSTGPNAPECLVVCDTDADCEGCQRCDTTQKVCLDDNTNCLSGTTCVKGVCRCGNGNEACGVDNNGSTVCCTSNRHCVVPDHTDLSASSRCYACRTNDDCNQNQYCGAW